MGYTHYWDNNGYDDAQFKDSVKECNKIIEAKKDILREWDGELDLVIHDSIISFNGNGDQSHESFVVENNGTGFEFCKTAFKPYDVAVVACLSILTHKLDNFEPRSDGTKDEWQEGVDLAREITGLDIKNPIE